MEFTYEFLRNGDTKYRRENELRLSATFRDYNSLHTIVVRVSAQA